MKYTFEAAIEQADNHGTIKIPFNVWEICKKEGAVPVKVRIESAVFVCNLEPLGKGYYNIPVHDNILKNFEVGKTYKVSFRITKSNTQDSPYSTSNPIRTIDNMAVVKQPHDGLCGQSCVAMLAGITLDEAIETMQCGEWQATMDKIVTALNYFGIDHTEEIIYTNGKPDVTLPKCCVIMEKMGRFSHYLVYFDGKGYDSNLGVVENYDMTKIKGYLEILV